MSQLTGVTGQATTSQIGDGQVTAAKLAANIGIQIWSSYVIPYTALQTAAMTNTITVLTLPSSGICGGGIVEITTDFSGTGITGLTVEVGTATNPSALLAPTSVFTGATTGVWIPPTGKAVYGNIGSTKAIQLVATSTGANLSALAAGSLKIDIWQAVLP